MPRCSASPAPPASSRVRRCRAPAERCSVSRSSSCSASAAGPSASPVPSRRSVCSCSPSGRRSSAGWSTSTGSAGWPCRSSCSRPICGVTVAVLSWRDAPAWTLFVFYGLSAVLPEPGPMSRARWAHIYRDEPDRLHTAMSFEQVCDEASFVVGPGARRARVDAVVPRGRPAARRAVLHGGHARLPRRSRHRAAGRAARRSPGRLRGAASRAARRRGRARDDRRHLRRQRGHRRRLRHRERRHRLLEHHPRGVRARLDPGRHRVREHRVPDDDDPPAAARGRRHVRARDPGPARRWPVAARGRDVRGRLGDRPDADHEPVAGPAPRARRR